MSGIRTSSRLEELYRLRRRIAHEIQVEEARTVDASAGRVRTPAAPAARPEPTLLEQLGVTSLDVKRWAHEHGLIETVARGRVPHALVEAYAQHHIERAR